MKYQPLLLRSFHSSGNKTSNPLERLSTGKTQPPLCQVRHKQPSAPHTCRTMNGDVVSCLCIGNRLLDCLLQVVGSWNTKIRHRQIEHLEARFKVQRSQIAAYLVETLFVAREG